MAVEGVSGAFARAASFVAWITGALVMQSSSHDDTEKTRGLGPKGQETTPHSRVCSIRLLDYGGSSSCYRISLATA